MATEYLTYVESTGNSADSFDMRYEDENVWLTQKMLATLYDVTVPAINQHLKRIFEDNELIEESVIKKYLITASDGKSYSTEHYNLQAIIAVGFKVNNGCAVRFRKWAGQIAKADVIVAKNYLSEKEMAYLERIVSLYLDYAELQAERRILMSVEDWAKRLDGFLEFNGNELLMGPGKVSAEQAKLHAETEFEKYRSVQDRLFMSDYDKYLIELEHQADQSDV